MAESTDVGELRVSLGRQLAAWREAAGVTQRSFATRLPYSRSTLANVETGRQQVPRDFWQRCDEVLGANGDLLTGFDQLSAAVAAQARRRAQRLPARRVVAVAPARGSRHLFESPAQVLGRRAKLHTSGLTEELLGSIEQFVVDVTECYEAEGPLALVSEIVQARQLVDELLAGSQRPRQRVRLFELGVQLSGQLSYIAINLGNFRAAHAYGAEAFELARYIEHDDLTAWVRGTQSLAAYYVGDYRQALALAADGQRYADGGVQAVRLAINGEARALGKLRDRRATTAAVTRAYRLLERFPLASGMTPCISFGLYSEARIASNAATAYLSLGSIKQVLSYAERARQIVDVSSSHWSRALVRLDTAMALLTAAQPEPEGASLFGSEAIAAVRDMRIESIQQRTHELATTLRSWLHLPSVADFLTDADSWLAADWSGRESD